MYLKQVVLLLALPALSWSAPVSDPRAAIGLYLAYDSNVYNGRGPDGVMRIAPQLDWELRSLRHQLEIGYRLGLWIYGDHKADNSINHQLGLSIHTRATQRLDLRLSYELVRAQDPAFLIRAGVVAPQTGIFDHFAQASLGYRMARRVDGEAGYGFRDTSFDPFPGVQLHDGSEHQGHLAIGWRAGRLDDLRIEHQLHYFLVDGRSFAIANSAQGGWRHRFLSTLEFAIHLGPVGYSSLDPVSPSGLTWCGRARLRLDGSTAHLPWRIHLIAARDLGSGTGAGAVLWVDYAALQASLRWPRRMNLGTSLAYFANGIAPSESRRFDGFTYEAVADLDLGHSLRAGAFYSFRWQESVAGAPLPDVTRHIVGIHIESVWRPNPPRHPEVEP